MPRLAWYAVALLCAMGLGAYALHEHQARVASDAKVAVWKDSVQRATVRAEAAEHLFDSTKAAYYRLPPATVQIVKWKSRIDTVLDSLQVSSKMDSADAAAVQVVFDSVTADCARRDSLARVALEAASGALKAKDEALRLALRPPVVPVQRVGFFVQAAYDPIQHAVPVQAGAELRLGHVKPFVAVGAAIAPVTTGTLQAGVRIDF